MRRGSVHRLSGAAGLLTLCGLLWAGTAHAQTPPERQGQALFQVHCAACHGLDARGHGPMAPALRRAPTDLTRLSSENGEIFPEARVRRIIDGRDVESHGTRDMPVWGDVFKTSGDNMPPRDTAERILAIVGYLQSLQQRRAQ